MFKKNHRHLQIPLTSHVDELPACACGTVQAKSCVSVWRILGQEYSIGDSSVG
jgi:hypothetical protein